MTTYTRVPSGSTPTSMVNRVDRQCRLYYRPIVLVIVVVAVFSVVHNARNGQTNDDNKTTSFERESGMLKRKEIEKTRIYIPEPRVRTSKPEKQATTENNESKTSKDPATSTCKVNCDRKKLVTCDLQPRTVAASDLIKSHSNLVNYNGAMSAKDQRDFKTKLYSPKYAKIFVDENTPDEIQKLTQLNNRDEFVKETKLHSWYVQTPAPRHRNDSGVTSAQYRGYLTTWVAISDSIKAYDSRKPEDKNKKFVDFHKPPYTYNGDQGLGALLMKYSTFMNDSRGTVIGSQKPWIETHLLNAGVKQVVTSEYTNYSSAFTQPDRLKYTHPDGLRALALFDFAVSFSSIEHSGLGRYGDPYNIVGDLVELARLSCVVKPGGLMFIGFPTGTDHVYGNWHRFYGPKRLSLLFDCWKLIDVQGKTNLDVETGGSVTQQPWFVLQNVMGCSNLN